MPEPIIIPENELPDWIRLARRGVDRGVLIVIILCLLVGWSFLLFPGLPRTNATESYVFRTADTVAAFQEGRLYPRWSPHALSGFGAPIPHYYPPGASYTAAIIDVLFTNDPVLAIRLLYVGSLCFAGAVVYALVMRRVDAASGILAAVLYVYSPFVGLFAPHVMGDLPGVMALALVPLLLWAVNRQLQANHPADFMFTALATAALLLTSPIHLPAGWLLCGLLIILHWREKYPMQPAMMAFFAGCVGISLAAFYWLPALAEYQLVRWLPATIQPETPRLTLAALFQPPQQLDPAALLPNTPLSLGTTTWLYALVGGVVLMRVKNSQGFQAGFLIAGSILMLIGLVAMPEAIWLMGIITLCLAIGGSSSLHLRRWLSVTNGRILLAALLMSAILFAIPVWMGQNRYDDFGSVDPTEQVKYEQQGFGVATLPPGAPVPSTLTDSITANRTLINGYLTGNINRFNEDPRLQNQASVLQEGTHSHRFKLQLTQGVVITMLNAFFPGWQAYLDNTPVATTSQSETGLITVNLQRASDEELLLILETTPERTAGWFVSGVTLIMLCFTTIRRLRRYRHEKMPLLHLLTPAESHLLFIVIGGIAGGALLVNLMSFPFSLRAEGYYGLRGSLPLRNRTTVGLEAYFYQLDKTNYTPGEPLDFTIYWQASQFLPENYQTQISLRAVSGSDVYVLGIARYPGNYPPRRWSRNRYVTDTYHYVLPQDLPAGRYTLSVEVYRCDLTCLPENRLAFYANNGALIGPVLSLPRIITIEN